MYKIVKIRGYPMEVEKKIFETEEEALFHMREGKEQWLIQFLFELDELGEIDSIIGRM